MPLGGNYIAHGNDTTRRTTSLLQAVANLQSALDLLMREHLIMTQSNQSGTNFTDIETLYSLEPGKGQAVNDIVGSAANELATNGAIQGLLQRLG